MRALWLGLLSTLLCLGGLAGSAMGREAAEVRWYVLAAEDGSRIGYASHEATDRSGGRREIDYQEVVLKEQGGRVSRLAVRTTTLNDAAGRPVTVTSEFRSGSSVTRIEARLSGDRAVIARQTASDRRTVTVNLPFGVRFDGGEALLRAWNPAVTPNLAFDSFNVDAMRAERVVVSVVSTDADGRVSALRRRYDGETLTGVARLTLDPGGRVLAATQPMFGTTVTTRGATQAEALTPHPPFQVLRMVMTKSPFRIPPSAVNGHIRYQFGFRDGINFSLPTTGEQRTTSRVGGTEVDICDGCGPGLPTTPDYLADALRPTVWMQSDAPKIRALVRGVGRLKVSDGRKMAILLQRAKPYLARVDFAGHYSALETLSRRAGDCTEAAVLLATLGRAAGIPTRVVNGMVYSRERYHGVSNAFMPHSWTLAYVDGEWRSYDLALERFDATHIALTIGDGDARSVTTAGQLASLLRWDSMVEIRSPTVP